MNGQRTSSKMEQELKIRKIGVEDIPVVVELANATWPATYSDILSPEQIRYMMDLFYTPSSLEIQMKEKNHQFIIAESNRKPVAFASYGSTGDTGVYKLYKIYIHPSMQHKGVGSKLINYIESELKAVNAKSLELNVNRDNKAKEFYERCNFEVAREENIDIGCGYFMNDYVMRKNL